MLLRQIILIHEGDSTCKAMNTVSTGQKENSHGPAVGCADTEEAIRKHTPTTIHRIQEKHQGDR